MLAFVDGFTAALALGDGTAPDAAGFPEAATRFAELDATAFLTESAEAVVASSEDPQAANAIAVQTTDALRNGTIELRMAAMVRRLDHACKTCRAMAPNIYGLTQIEIFSGSSIGGGGGWAW